MKGLWILVLLGACAGDTLGGKVIKDTSESDTVGPEITHDPISEPQIYGEAVTLEAVVIDAESDVWRVEFVYQAETAGSWTERAMSEVGGGLFQGQINGDDIRSGGMRYYIRAYDFQDNLSCLPTECELEPWHFSIVPG